MVEFDKEVDIIICGGGAAGSVIAGRLATADPLLKILVIEAGMNNLNHSKVIAPAMFLSHLSADSETAYFHLGRPSHHLNGRTPIVPGGKILGGGSSINFMLYARGSASDYDDWKMPGWSSKDVIPLLKSTETYRVRSDEPNEPTHGYQGPLHVSKKQMGFLGHEFHEVVKNYGKIPAVKDLNDLNLSHGVQACDKWINHETGRRSDAAHGFIHPTMKVNPNLELLLHTRVKKVLFEDDKAVGVECFTNPSGQSLGSIRQTIKARKLVIISSGAIHSPQILQRSGIGSKVLLESLGSKQIISDLPGVGKNYQDHELILVPYQAQPQTETFDKIWAGDEELMKRNLKEFEVGNGSLTGNWIDSGVMLRPSENELKGLGPEFNRFWAQMFENAPDKPVLYIAMIGGYVGDLKDLPVGKYFTLGCFLTYPESIGHVNVTSLDDLDALPDFDPGFLSSSSDVAPLIWAYKLGREYARRMPSYLGELKAGHPNFSSKSKVTCNQHLPELPSKLNESQNHLELSDERLKSQTSIEDLSYSSEDDLAIENFVRDKVQTTWHSLGTSAMKPREENGVVDARLNVYGTRNLKVADISICPGNVGANTYSTALMIGEKAARLIMEDLKIHAN